MFPSLIQMHTADRFPGLCIRPGWVCCSWDVYSVVWGHREGLCMGFQWMVLAVWSMHEMNDCSCMGDCCSRQGV